MPLLLPVLLGLACQGRSPEDSAPDAELPVSITQALDCEEPLLLDTLTHVFLGTASDCEVQHYARHLRERSEEIGPWIHDLRLARSTDGLDFVMDDLDPVVSTASSAGAIRGDDGRIYLYYVDGDVEAAIVHAAARSDWFLTHGLGGYGAIRLMISDDDGLTFAEETDFGITNIVQGLAVDPDPIRAPDGSWRLYYMGLPVPAILDPVLAEEGAPHPIFMASSDDLVHWTQGEVVVDGPFADPATYCATTVSCWMLSFGLDRSSSLDGGATFTFEGSWDDLRGFAPAVLPLEDGRLRALYNSMEAGAPVYARISDNEGLTWTDEEGEQLDVYGEAPTAVQAEDGSWLLYFHKFKEGMEPDFAKDDSG